LIYEYIKLSLISIDVKTRYKVVILFDVSPRTDVSEEPDASIISVDPDMLP